MSTTAAAVDHLTHHASEIGDRPALIDDRPGGDVRILNFTELNALANRLANGLADLGVALGEHVSWWGQNSVEAMTSIHAIRKLAGVSVPIPYRSTADEAVYLLDNADTVVLIVDAKHAELVAQITSRLPRLRQVIVYGGPPLDGQLAWDDILGAADTPANEGAVEATRTMIYTSGTTGQPKGAVRKVGGAPNQFTALLELIGWRDFPLRFLTTGPLYHSGPSGFGLRAQIVGGTIVLQHKFDAEDWLRLVQTYEVNCSFSAPTPIRRVTQLPDDIKASYDVSSMRSFIANAAPWTMDLKRAYLDYFPTDSLWEVYGSTELSVCTALAPADQLRKPGSCGQAAPGVDVVIMDPDGNEITEPGEPGELFARSAGMFDDYHKAHDRYLEDTRGDFHTVGDIAYRDEEDYFYICDRKKDMIITGGVNVYPAEVENVLDDHPLVAEVAVLGMPDPEWEEVVCAVVVARDGFDADALVEWSKERLSGPKRPKRIEVVDELPKTGTGKVLKRQLRTELG